MLEKIFITGTASSQVLNLGNCKEYIGQQHYYHAVSSTQPKSVHVSHLSAYVAPLICSYAKSNLSQIDNIIVCLKIPALLPFSEQDKEHIFANVFQVEWFFSLDIIRHALKLFEFQKGLGEKEVPVHHRRGKLYICIPHMLGFQLNDAQRMYYNSILTAIKSFIHEVPTPHELGIIMTRAQSDDKTHAVEILELLNSLREKNIHKRVFYVENLLPRIKNTIFKSNKMGFN